MDVRITGPGTNCIVDGCPLVVHAKGHCQTHYAQAKRHGRIYRLEDHTPCPMCRSRFIPKNVRDIYCSGECLNMSRRLRRHSLSTDTFWQLYELQSAKCAVCEIVLRFSEVRIDHDHRCCAGSRSCGKCVRGLVCHLCNVGMGALGDDAAGIQKALLYLLAWQHPKSEVMTSDAIYSSEIWHILNERLSVR